MVVVVDVTVTEVVVVVSVPVVVVTVVEHTPQSSGQYDLAKSLERGSDEERKKRVKKRGAMSAEWVCCETRLNMKGYSIL